MKRRLQSEVVFTGISGMKGQESLSVSMYVHYTRWHTGAHSEETRQQRLKGDDD